MKPITCLRVLDIRYGVLERRVERFPPDSRQHRGAVLEMAAIAHARRLVAFEVQHLNTLKTTGAYKNNRQSPEFLRSVVEGAPKDDEEAQAA